MFVWISECWLLQLEMFLCQLNGGIPRLVFVLVADATQSYQ